MPDAPPRACGRCGRLITDRCPSCTQAYDQTRGSAQRRHYTAHWAEYSRHWLAHFPWCGQRQDGQLYAEHSRCVQEGRHVRARVTDHIRPLRQGGSLFDPANHQSLCVRCNTRKG